MDNEPQFTARLEPWLMLHQPWCIGHETSTHVSTRLVSRLW
ncbi:MAG TPA: hypothetical protein VF600_08045 [Abditibacteriaceae bacterium]